MKDAANAGDPHDQKLPSDWIIDTRIGIEKLLRAIVQARRPARVASRTTRERATVRLLEIDTRGARILFVPLSAGPVQSWLDGAREVLFITDHDGVPIEFTCERPARVASGDSHAYAVRFPPYIIRLQRRNAYRLPAPAITCTLRDEHGHDHDQTPQVLDISGGGVDLSLPVTERRLSTDAPYECTIVLPGFGTVWTHVRIVSVSQGPDAHRYGCQFVNLPAASELLLQRYILEEQRARRRNWRIPGGPRT